MSKLLKSTLAITAMIISCGGVIAQGNKTTRSAEVPKGWHLMDKSKDGQFGISLDKAYEFVRSKNLKSKTVLVAVIDSGIDTLHEDLKEILWRNPNEIPANGKDDDGNGYVDDIYGWNFLGNKDGRNVEKDSYEGARVYHSLKSKYEGKTINAAELSKEDQHEYEMWKKAKAGVIGSENDEVPDLFMLKRILTGAKRQDSILRKGLKKESYSGNDLDKFEPSNQSEKSAKAALLYLFKANNMMETTNTQFMEELEDYINMEERKAESKEKAPVPYRTEIVGDDENNINDKYYGNANVMVNSKSAEHGTHVAGIIGAARKNGKGGDGIADNVRIMMIRAVPDGDEHDKDIALAIRYAVDNGAKIVNMSFGKSFSPGKKWVDDAMKYAESKGVLLVHAAGNDHKNIDSLDNFPNAVYLDSGVKATNWITVGASANGNPDADGFTASFSNYGKDQVDLFAPGSRIYSTFPGGNVYRSLDGTSMASPVVAGTAALLLSYFPYLTPQQLKYCIEKSATAPGEKVKKPGTDDLVELSDISKTGGILNALQAVTLAASLQPQQPAPPPAKKKQALPTLKNKKG